MEGGHEGSVDGLPTDAGVISRAMAHVLAGASLPILPQTHLYHNPLCERLLWLLTRYCPHPRR